VSSDDRAMIESACRKQRAMRGPAAYYGCISQQLAALASNPDRPSFAGVASDRRATIESACQPERMYRGPAAYYGCVSQQLAILSRREKRRLGLQPDEQISLNSGAFGTTHKQAIPQQSSRTGSAGSKPSGSPATKLEAPQQQTGETPKEHSLPADSSASLSAIAIGVVGTAIALFVLGFGFRLFRRPQRSPCARCGTPVSRAVNHCPSCVVAMQEEARRASAQWQTQERQWTDEQRRQREHAEEEARQSYSSGDETGRHRREPADDGHHGFDPYAVLGVARDAGKEDIRAAYLREMASYHPDKVSHLGADLQELAKHKAQAINRAYEELMSSASA
jgi:hypothetical protein